MGRILSMLIAAVLSAQPAPLAFETVSIRENTTIDADGIISGPSPGRFTVVNSTVASMIRYAYRLRDYQLLDAPNWASTINYDVIATYPEGLPTPSDDQVRQMVKALLADRFGLRVHGETRQLPLYELRVARADGTLGPQMKPSTIDCSQPPPPSAGRAAFPVCQGFQTRSFIQSRAQTLDGLASALQAMVKQRVLDRTGLKGPYEVTVRWGDARGPAEEATVEEIAAMMTALQEQLGLKLESRRAPEDVIVVDAVRRPTANA
jgi:uncharacterized protein (TIGR03435 family)